jgi:hypothetical protein
VAAPSPREIAMQRTVSALAVTGAFPQATTKLNRGRAYPEFIRNSEFVKVDLL